MKHKVFGMFKEFYERNIFERSLNATFILLIPKKNGNKIGF